MKSQRAAAHPKKIAPALSPPPNTNTQQSTGGRGGIAEENYVDAPPVSLLREGIDGPDT
jgi:hypothetical protein